MTKLTAKQDEMAKIKEELIQYLENCGHQVYTSLLHVSSSGMSRRISAYIIKGSDIINIDWHIEKLGLYKRSTKGGLSVGGCGSDMGFEVVYNLSSSLYRNEDGSYSHEGAYKLKQRWL